MEINSFYLEKVFTKKECNNIVNFYVENSNKSYSYKTNGTYPLTISKFTNPIIKNMINKLEDKYLDKFNASRIDNLEIVKWPEGSCMNNHYDGEDKFAFFIYLNDNFTGGETEIVGEAQIVPATGYAFIFNNGKRLHKVNKVINGIRYTLAGWYV
jgi:hypothetical protein